MNFVALLRTLFQRTPLDHCIYEDDDDDDVDDDDDERSISTAKKKKKKRIRMFINKNYLSMTFIFLRGLS